MALSVGERNKEKMPVQALSLYFRVTADTESCLSLILSRKRSARPNRIMVTCYLGKKDNYSSRIPSTIRTVSTATRATFSIRSTM